VAHQHTFKHTGGGGLLCPPAAGCYQFDDSYECECGNRFVVHTNEESVHFSLPGEISFPVQPVIEQTLTGG